MADVECERCVDLPPYYAACDELRSARLTLQAAIQASPQVRLAARHPLWWTGCPTSIVVYGCPASILMYWLHGI